MTDNNQQPAARRGLTDNEIRATIYFAVGVTSESGENPFRLAVAGDNPRTPRIEVAANSGYTFGTVQIDLGQHYQPNVRGGENVPADLVNAYQAWARQSRQAAVLTPAEAAEAISDLGRQGHEINRQGGTDLDPDVRRRLNGFLASDAGVTWGHNRDVAQVEKLMDNAIEPMRRSQLYRNASEDDQVRLVAMVAKVYNQNENEAGPILNTIARGGYRGVDQVSNAIGAISSSRTDYLEEGRDKALQGARVVNALRNSHPGNPLHAAWDNVLDNPLVRPNRLDRDPQHPNLPGEYGTVRRLFANYQQALPFIDALDRGGSYQQAQLSREQPGRFVSNGVYASGNNFVTWDTRGNGHAYLNGGWSAIDRDDLQRVNRGNGVIDLNMDRGGGPKCLLTVDPRMPALRPGQRRADLSLDGDGAPGVGHVEQAALGRINGVLAADGRWTPEQCDNISAQLLCRHRLDSPGLALERVAIGHPTATGEVHVFAMHSTSGERGPHFYSHVEAGQAARVPASQSYEQLAQIGAQQSQQQSQQQTQGQGGQDAPSRGGHRMG
ncbi:hypothetical protein [Lysobacter sp. Root983]|uniref:hypothetical protein n=1 Tax=Lysobacter sp. Root983 TaxID=1736613 RepID=UPI0007096A50|nr:hypothetical protein [Lysobacter sp. Root983]KRD80216.1 hypothetical protein ASE43_04935 [Lysobacter sp. Root983]